MTTAPSRLSSSGSSARRYPFNARGDYWAFWVNGKAASSGRRATWTLQEGDEVLFFVDQCFDAQPPDYACKNDAGAARSS